LLLQAHLKAAPADTIPKLLKELAKISIIAFILFTGQYSVA